MAKAFKELTEEERQRQQRRQEIARLWAEGESCRAIGERFGLTRQAVHDLLCRMEGGPVTPGFAQLVRRWPYPNAARWVLESGYTSIAELARETGIPDNTLRNILRGNTFPKPETVRPLLELSGMSFAEFFHDPASPPPSPEELERQKTEREQARKERRKAYLRDYYQKNQERIRARAREWNRAHPANTPEAKAARAEYDKAYNAANQEQRAAYRRAYYRANPELYARKRKPRTELPHQLTLEGKEHE